MDPKDIRGLSLGAMWTCFRRTGLSGIGPSKTQRAGWKRPMCIGTIRV
jgi:hypothetical protein